MTPGTDETGMKFRRSLPEIRCQSRLSPVSITPCLPEIRCQSRLSPVCSVSPLTPIYVELGYTYP